MVALFFMLNIFRINGITISCLKQKEDISKFSSYDFRWNLAKALAFSHVLRQKLYALTSVVQLKMKIFLGIALEVPEPVPNIENKYESTNKWKRCKIKRIIVKVRVKKIIFQCLNNNASHVVKVFVEHIP